MLSTRKIILIIFCLGWLMAGPVFADTSDLSEKPGTLPTSKFYFLKSWGEWARMNILTINKEKKAKLSLRFAEKRLVEMDALKEKDKLDEKQTEKLTKKYQSLMDKVERHMEKKNEKGEDDTVVVSEVSEKMTKHQRFFDDIRENVPEPSKQAIEKSKEKSLEGEKKAVETLIGYAKDNKSGDGETFTAQKIKDMILELQKHIEQHEAKLSKWEQEGKDISASKAELDKAKNSLTQAQIYLDNKEFKKAFESVREGKGFLSGLEKYIDKIKSETEIKEKIKENSTLKSLKEKVEDKVKGEVKREVKEEVKSKVDTTSF